MIKKNRPVQTGSYFFYICNNNTSNLFSVMRILPKTIWAPILSGLAIACVSPEPEKLPAGLSVDENVVEVEADNALISDPFSGETLTVTDTVMVSSSRSWTVSIVTDDGGDWVRTGVKQRINASGSEETVPLVFAFDRYRGHAPRTATAYIYAAELDAPLAISLTQKAFTPVLELEAYTSATGVSAQGGECCVIIRSNTSWTASIDNALSTAAPDLSMTAGQDSKAVYVAFQPNIDDERAKIATLVVKAADCAPVSMEIFQSQSERFFYLESEVPSVIEPYEDKILIPLRSNGPWTAELKECTFSGAVLEPSAGSNALNGFQFTADHGADPDAGVKSATILIRRNGMEDITVSFSQVGSIHLSFCEFNPEYEFTGRFNDAATPYTPYKAKPYPFSSPDDVPRSFSVGTFAGEPVDFVTKKGDFVFTMFGQDCGVWKELESFGWLIGKTKDDYVLFPAVEGRRLSKMYYEATCRAVTPYTVRTEDGSAVIKGGEYSVTKMVVPVEGNHHDMHVHSFPSTQPGERYRLNLEETFRMISIKDLCLIYE